MKDSPLGEDHHLFAGALGVSLLMFSKIEGQGADMGQHVALWAAMIGMVCNATTWCILTSLSSAAAKHGGRMTLNGVVELSGSDVEKHSTRLARNYFLLAFLAGWLAPVVALTAYFWLSNFTLSIVFATLGIFGMASVYRIESVLDRALEGPAEPSSE